MPVQKFCAPFAAVTLMEVLTEGAEPPVLEAITEKVVVADGAATFTAQAVDEMPLLQLQEVGELPPLQLAERVTVVPAKTASPHRAIAAFRSRPTQPRRLFSPGRL